MDVLVSVINHHINELHLFWGTLYLATEVQILEETVWIWERYEANYSPYKYGK